MLPNEPTGILTRKGPPRPQDAIALIPASAASYDMTSEDDIGDALTALAARGDAISMYAAGSREALLGRILSVDPELPHFVMELNEGQRLPHGNVNFVAVLPTAKMQFQLSNSEWTSVAGKPLLIQMTFPASCKVLDRRASERVETPLGANYMASFVINGTNLYELPIYDFSLGGIGLRCAKNDAKGLLKGRKLRDVELDFGSETVVIAEMEIRVTRAYRSFLLGEQLHIGCMFINLEPVAEGRIRTILDQVNNAARQR